ncbi:uncharacterized protein BDR25DRAFT_69850 [Lindgomyces ingoldianus]|uniref:Uncharacterized protein n=1 Tax=Lindgomyces ingoldianus TaxID=673940 RepID=A0ACB6QK47_9PLEO|nr:uncharacterized protein BDR25DRAFT_69850 [Lindgomyces ingoldianus]KAF2467237.1 hypothetical protein BDR25DRAFT_69850 [Lindgomyces ingoldianus]
MFRPSFLFLLPFALFESACAATITSAPPFPTTNATSTSVSPSTCPTGKCAFKLPVGSQLQWFRFSPSTTIVAATVSVFIVNGTNTTSTTTIFNDLPSGIAPPPTNAAGTRTTVVTSFAGGTVEVISNRLGRLRFSRNMVRNAINKGHMLD